MTYRGRIKGGVVVLEGDTGLPEGTEVRVEPVVDAGSPVKPSTASPLYRAAERAKPTGIPDLAINHDHYSS